MACPRPNTQSNKGAGKRPACRQAGAPTLDCIVTANSTIFLKEAPVLDPRPGNASPYRIPMKPAGGPSPAGAEFAPRKRSVRHSSKSDGGSCARGATAARCPAKAEIGVQFPVRAPSGPETLKAM